MAYRSTLQKSTVFTRHFLVFGHELSLFLDLKYKPPHDVVPVNVKKYVLSRQKFFRRAHELVRRHATAQQLWRNNSYNWTFLATPSTPQSFDASTVPAWSTSASYLSSPSSPAQGLPPITHAAFSRKPWFREFMPSLQPSTSFSTLNTITDRAARQLSQCLHFALSSCILRETTAVHRKAEALHKLGLLRELTDFISIKKRPQRHSS